MKPFNRIGFRHSLSLSERSISFLHNESLCGFFLVLFVYICVNFTGQLTARAALPASHKSFDRIHTRDLIYDEALKSTVLIFPIRLVKRSEENLIPFSLNECLFLDPAIRYRQAGKTENQQQMRISRTDLRLSYNSASVATTKNCARNTCVW